MKERIYTYKYRLYPNSEQKSYLSKVFGCCRLVYNHFLNEKKNQYKETKTSDNYYTQQSKLTQLRKEDEFSFPNEVSLQSLQCSPKNMHTAYDRFYKHKGGYPNYKSKRDKQCFKLPQERNFRIKDNKLYIPKLNSGIDIVLSKDIVGKICFATISKTKTDKYFISITVRQESYMPYSKTGKSVGLDLGIKDLVITSDNTRYARKIQQIRQLKRQLKHNQRHLSRKKHGSNRYEKQVLNCNLIYEKITNVKIDCINKITTELVKRYDIIKIEDLDVKGMMSNHKLAEVISECNWSQLVTMLEYKCRWNDKELIKVDRYFPSSQLCNVCGHKNPKVKNLDIREWTCPICGSNHDRDLNAAINILKYNSARNVEYSRGGVNKPNETSCIPSDCSDSCETISQNRLASLK